MVKIIKRICYLALLLVVGLIFFVSCTDNKSANELKEYVLRLRHQPKNAIKKTPFSLNEPLPVKYAAKTSPFKTDTAPSAKNILPREIELNPLLGYSLNMLRFVGTLVDRKIVIAYILAPDNKIYPVKIGDRIGDQNGMVTAININEIAISESGNKIITLELKEAQE